MFRTEQDFLEWLQSGHEGVGYFVNPTYWQAVVGIKSSDGGIVYDYERMVDVLVVEDGMSTEEAREWIDYNVVRTIPYCGDIKPEIVETFEY